MLSGCIREVDGLGFILPMVGRRTRRPSYFVHICKTIQSKVIVRQQTHLGVKRLRHMKVKWRLFFMLMRRSHKDGPKEKSPGETRWER